MNEITDLVLIVIATERVAQSSGFLPFGMFDCIHHITITCSAG